MYDKEIDADDPNWRAWLREFSLHWAMTRTHERAINAQPAELKKHTSRWRKRSVAA
jgi:hypothetical protein